VSIEVTGLDSLIADLTVGVREVLAENSRKAVQVFATKVKKDWRAGVSGQRHLPGLPPAIGYDIRQGVGWVEATIGADNDKGQGALAVFDEYGGPHNPPRGTGVKALAANADDLVRGMEIAFGSVL
jgi:hypothetical protein